MSAFSPKRTLGESASRRNGPVIRWPPRRHWSSIATKVGEIKLRIGYSTDCLEERRHPIPAAV